MEPKTGKAQPNLTTQASGLMVAKTLGFVLATALPLLLVRLLNQATFGVYKQIFLVVATAQSLLSLGFAMSAFYFFPRYPTRRGAIALNILLHLGGVGLAACLTLAVNPHLLVRLVGNPELESYGRLIGLAILTQLLGMFLETAATAQREVRLSAYFIIGSQLSRNVLMVSAALFWISLRSLLLAMIVHGILQFTVLVLYLHRSFPHFWRQFDGALWLDQMRYAIPMGLAATISTLLYDLHNYFVAHRFDAATYAIYAVGCFQLPLIWPLQESVGSVLMMRMSELEAEGRRHDIVRLLAAAMRKLAAIYWPLYVLLLVVGRDLLVFLYTARFTASWPIFAVYLTLLPINILVLDPVSRSYPELRRFQLILRGMLLAGTLAGLWLGVLRWGMMGAVGVVVAAFSIEAIAMGWQTKRLLGLTSRDLHLFSDVAKLGGAAAAAGAATFAVHHLLLGLKPFLILAICSTVMTLVYVLLVVLLHLPNDTERDQLRALGQRLLRVTAL